MNRLGKKAAVLALLAVVATALMGAAYTLWYEDLSLNATVSTGTVNGTWNVVANCSDVESKDVGHFVLGPGTVPIVSDTLTLEVTGAYPQYFVNCELHIKGLGSVPFHIESYQLDLAGPGVPAGTSKLCDYAWANDPLGGPCTVSSNALEVTWTDNLGAQCHAGQQTAGSLQLLVKQPALENSTYTFTMKAHLVQWNESQFPVNRALCR